MGVSLKSVLEYYQQLRVLMHAWAWAGNYFVKYNHDQILMMDLTTSLSYADRCLKDVLEFGGGSLRWLERNDVLTRGKMSTYVRRGFPASVALVEALRETHIEWRSPVVSVGFETPVAKRKRGSSSDDLPPPPAPSKRSRAVKSDTFKTVSMIKGGARLCKPWNDGRGCSSSSCQALHQCDVKLPSGLPCLSKKHTRLEHE